MRLLLKVIEEERARYEEHPWFAFLRDASIPAEYRLSYAPVAAHFIMTFSDINRLMMDGPPDDPYTEVVRRHAREDATHWAWFLKDMETLGWNPETTFNDALRFVFRDEGRRTRELGYHMAAQIIPASPQLRYCLIEAIEAMGNVWLNATIVAARQSRHARKLIYFGGHHLERETGHAIGAESFREDTKTTVLDDAMRERAIEGVRLLFAKMSAFNTEIHEHSLNLHRSGNSPATFMQRRPAASPENEPLARRLAERALKAAEGWLKEARS